MKPAGCTTIITTVRLPVAERGNHSAIRDGWPWPLAWFPARGELRVLLLGLANDLVGPATLMVVSISGGMALVMSGIGVIRFARRNLLDGRPGASETPTRQLANSTRITGASLVLTIGPGLFGLAWTSDFKIPLADRPSRELGPALKSTASE